MQYCCGCSCYFSERFILPSERIPNDSCKGCKVCHKTVKGNRGLTIHLNRNPNCKRNVSTITKVNRGLGCGGACAGHCSTDFDDLPAINVVNNSLPCKVSDAVKSLSTFVESLEYICQDGSVSKICKHPHKKN